MRMQSYKLLVALVVLMTVVCSCNAARNVTVYMGNRPQLLVLWEADGTASGAFEVGTGKQGYETPARVWSAVAKNATAYSSKYTAPMPFAVRLGRPYDGFNLHFDPEQGVPVSHGCIRQHFKGAITVFNWASIGTVVETKNSVAPHGVNVTDTSRAFVRDWYEVGDKDGAVIVVQNALVHWKLMQTSAITGVYDAATAAAVSTFQKAHGLSVDGKAGIATMQVMLSYQNSGF